MTKVLFDPPSRLETPPISLVDPPIVPRGTELPFDQISWEDFERLCLRLARLQKDVVQCQLYGEPGDDQEGIDIYSRHIDGSYSVHQCKRQKKFGPAKIKEATKKFLDEAWATKADALYLCTQESLRLKQRLDAFEAEAVAFQAQGKILVKWDSDELSLLLRDHPEIIDDFFGRLWVVRICGEEEAAKLGGRLDATQVREFRSRMASFYHHIFNRHDYGLPGLTAPMQSEVLPLEERYVLPEISDLRRFDVPHSTLPQEPSMREDYIEDIEYSSDMAKSHRTLLRRRTQKRKRTNEGLQHRQGVSAWLASEQKSLIVGGPGSGKSALLRFIAIDLLQEAPRLTEVAAKWGTYLPIWLPFAWWTNMIAEPLTGAASLSDMLYAWLRSHDEEERLWPLVEQALNDERLLLLVDGLDEWSTEDAARIALNRLQVFIDQRDVPAVVTTRRTGFEKLGIQIAGWQLGEIGDFSIQQQRELAFLWFEYKLHLESAGTTTPGQTSNETKARAQYQADQFISQVQGSVDLQELAKVPLLLCVLISYAVRNIDPPRNRFEAYNSLVEHLIATHPRLRRAAASFVVSSAWPMGYSDSDVKLILGYLAYTIQEHFGSGIIGQSAAEHAVAEFLIDPEGNFGLDKSRAKQDARALLAISEDAAGILVRPAPEHIRFLHRTLQECLAAYYLSSRPLDEQAEVIKSRCADLQWREMILCTFYRVERPADVKQLLSVIEEHTITPLEKYIVDPLLAELTFGNFKCPADLAKELAHTFYTRIETEAWQPQRDRLLGHVLDGLRSPKLRASVLSRLKTWYPDRHGLRSYTFRQMANWPRTPELVECLWRAMHDPDEQYRRAAAEALADVGSGDDILGDQMAMYALTAVDPEVRAVALAGLLRGWPEHPRLDGAIRAARASLYPLLRLVAITGKIARAEHDESDRQEMLSYITGGSDLGHYWNEDVLQAIITGWRRDGEIKTLCLKLSQTENRQRRFGADFPFFVLIAGYPQDSEVAHLLGAELKEDPLPFGGIIGEHGAWHYVIPNFRDNRVLIDAIDKWLSARDEDPWDMAIAARIGRSPLAKQRLLSSLRDRPTGPCAYVLLEEWGMDDPEVVAALEPIAYGSAERGCEISGLLPRIITDPVKCRQRLLELLRDVECKKPASILWVLHTLGDLQDDLEVIDAALQRDLYEADYSVDLRANLIRFCSRDERVRQIAIKELDKHSIILSAIAEAYGHEVWFRQQIMDRCCPLGPTLRTIIAERLSGSGVDDSDAFELLSSYDEDPDRDVKTLSSIGYHTLLKLSGSDTSEALVKLSKGLLTRDFPPQASRQASFCGLAILERLDVLLNLTERWGEKDRPLAISIGDSDLDLNAPLVRFILQNWNSLKETLGDEFWDRITGHRVLAPEPWDLLAIFADDYPAPRAELSATLEEGELQPSTNLLRFLERVYPKSVLLLEACLQCLAPNRTTHHLPEQTLVAAEMVGRHFYGDSAVLAKLLQIREPTTNPGPDAGKGSEIDQVLTIALCEGWPESLELESLWETLLKPDPLTGGAIRVPYSVLFPIACAKAPPDHLLVNIQRFLHTKEQHASSVYGVTARPLIRRLRIDDQVVTHFVNRLQKGASPSEQATFARTLAIARGLQPNLQHWSENSLNNQLAEENIPEIGFDLVAGDLQPVAHSLLAILIASLSQSYD